MRSIFVAALVSAAALTSTNAAVLPRADDVILPRDHLAGGRRGLCIKIGNYWIGIGCPSDGNGGNNGNGNTGNNGNNGNGHNGNNDNNDDSGSAASSSAAAYSSSSSAAAYSSSSSAAAYSSNAAAYSSNAAAYSSSAAAYSTSAAAAYSRTSSAAAYSSSSAAAAYSSDAVAYSSNAAVYSSNAAAYSSSAAAYSQSTSAAAYSASADAAQSSLNAYSASVSAAAYESQAAAYSASSSIAAYSASVSDAAYSEAVATASASASLAAYSASQSEAAYSASSASAYSASVSAAAAQSTAVPTGWNVASSACISEGVTGRALTSDSMNDGEMTWAKCTSYCGSKGYPLAGIEYARECYCGYVLSNGASLERTSSQCNMATCGNPNTVGGGPSVLSLFVSDSLDISKYTSDLTSIHAPLPGSWSASLDSGVCVKEGSTGRALAGAMFAADDMTIDKCVSFCAGKSMQYAGLEYGRECYCGNDLVNGASLSDTAPCSFQCAGQPGTLCGGGNLLSIYRDANYQYTSTQVGSYAKQGCIQEVGGRALTEASIATADMTIEKCTTFCADGGFAWAGLEYGSECYCGTSLSNGASLSSYSTQCNMACSGNEGETCGGPNAITLYSSAEGNALVGA